MYLNQWKGVSKKWAVVLASFVLLWQVVFPGFAYAGGVIAPGSEPLSQDPTVSLEKAISIVKENFNIPQEYTEFTSGLNMYNQNQTWSLNWSSSEQPGGSFSAQVDVNTGEIINMNNWRNNTQPGPTTQIPKIQASEAKDIALKLVTRLASEKLPDLQLMPMDDTVIPLVSYGPVTYTIHWQRLINKIPFPNDGVTVQVNAVTGDILSYSLNWTALSQIPEATGIITESKAEESFLNNKILELQYFTPSPIKPLASGMKQEVKLVYQMNGDYPGGAIDALTGEPLKGNYGPNYANTKGGFGGMPNIAPATSDQNSTPLTPAEQEEIDKNAQLLTQDEAVLAVKSWVTIPDSLVLQGSNLSSEGMFGNRRIWNLSWSGKSGDQPQFMSAQVDAVTGELLGFNLPYQGNGNEKPVIDRNQAQTIAEDFIKKIEPIYFKEIKLSDENYPLGKGNSDNGPQMFNYYREVNDIPYRSNGINITVDPVSKKIISYNLNWFDLQFPSITGILDGKQAGETLLKAEPLELMYTQVFDQGHYDSPGELHLVYQPTPTDGLPVGNNILDAETGEFLDWQGQPASQMPRAYHFSDIAGNFAQKEIALLGQAGIFGEYLDSFHPEEKITMGSLLTALQALSNGYGAPFQTSDDIIKVAQQQGWLTKDVQPSATIDREDFTKLMFRYLKLEPAAKLSGIYQTPYTDVSKDFIGYAALAKGIGMFNIDGETFDPSHVMTRAEAAYALVKCLMFQS